MSRKKDGAGSPVRKFVKRQFYGISKDCIQDSGFGFPLPEIGDNFVRSLSL